MICLSRADEGAFRHLTYNQSPSPLAAQHTTRQDLNGLANLREHVDADQDDGSAGVGMSNGSSSSCGDEKHEMESRQRGGEADAGRESRWAGLSSCLGADAADFGFVRLPAWRFLSSWCASHARGWVAWLLSVIVVSSLLSAWKTSSPTLRFASDSTFTSSALQESSHSHPSVGNVSAPVELASLMLKRSTCASGGVDKDLYNTPLHAGALAIILCVSSLACAFPILATKYPGLKIPGRFFFTVRHFGTGVLIATAFVHLLPTAFISLGNPCLGGFWINDYPAIPGAISLAAIFFVTIIEMVFHPARHIPLPEPASNGRQVSGDDIPNNHGCMGSVNLPVRDMGPLRGRQSSIGQGLSTLQSNQEDGTEEDESRGQGYLADRSRAKESFEETTVESQHSQELSPEQKQRKELLQCVLLEFGILFHSIFIGMALSVSIGNKFIVLLIAIVFHQTFEGLALGSRIAAIKWSPGKKQPWLMALAYGCTTPLGQAIGLATHTLYSPNSEIGLIVVGVMNAISAGLLTFASLVELLSEDFLSDESWRFLRGRKRVIACLLVFFGAFAMSLVGAWA
ncbi:hypothetical protein G7046_g4839 [Stylonectria norvegica]|nr:hypothetical protein G7046_g4839 [Stylonectria norvegica]